MNRPFALAALAVALVACARVPGGADASPVLDRPRAEATVMRGDDALRSALAGIDDAGLANSFHDPALAMLRLEVRRLAQRGLRIQERDVKRTLVFFDPQALEAVLDVQSQHRLVSPDQPDPPWAATERQWWVTFAFATGTWWVVEQHDLTPDRWFKVT